MELFPMLVAITVIGLSLIIASQYRSRVQQPLKRLAVVAAVVLVGVTVGATFRLKSLASPYFLPNGWTGNKVLWRAKLFARKAEGDVPDFSWRELWFMALVRGGFGLGGFTGLGTSVEGAIINPYITPADY
jgi:hypothetical protein